LRIAEARPDLFDVGLTSIDPAMEDFFSGEQMRRVRATLGKKLVPHVDSRAAMPRFKFVINVAAVLSSWRTLDLMSSGALMFLQESSDMDVVHARLAPWVHYVPVRNDLSDLVELVERMRGDDAAAKRIADAGLAFFRANATRSDLVCYVWRLVRSIAGNTDLTGKRRDDWLKVTSGRGLGFRDARAIVGGVPRSLAFVKSAGGGQGTHEL